MVEPMSQSTQYQHLESRPGSNYQQLWVKGRHIRAEVLHRQTIGPEPRSVEVVGRDYDLPIEAVLEAVDYAVSHESLLQAERSREEDRLRSSGIDLSRPVAER